jgi:hypothetical protein
MFCEIRVYFTSKKSSPQVQGPKILAGTCSPLDRMYVTPMPTMATLTMAENHIKTDSIGLQLQVECWYEQEELPQEGSSPLFPLQSQHNRVILPF